MYRNLALTPTQGPCPDPTHRVRLRPDFRVAEYPAAGKGFRSHFPCAEGDPHHYSILYPYPHPHHGPYPNPHILSHPHHGPYPNPHILSHPYPHPHPLPNR